MELFSTWHYIKLKYLLYGIASAAGFASES
jgi:hypothetical protein